MGYDSGIFKNYMDMNPIEIERMFHAVEYIVKQGVGSNILDELVRKKFKDTEEEYLNQIRNKALKQEDGLFIIYRALVKWYETWEHTFSNFNEKNASAGLKEQPIHTWLHCFLTGQSQLYNNLIGEKLILVEESKWKESEKITPSFQQEFKVTNHESEKIERLLKLSNIDEEVRYKELLLEKKLAIFLEDEWEESKVDEIKNEYHLKNIRQFSSIELPKNLGDFDYCIFLASRAKHGVKYKIESSVSKKNIFYVSSTNYQLVMKEFTEQLKGKKNDE